MAAPPLVLSAVWFHFTRQCRWVEVSQSDGGTSGTWNFDLGSLDQFQHRAWACGLAKGMRWDFQVFLKFNVCSKLRPTKGFWGVGCVGLGSKCQCKRLWLDFSKWVSSLERGTWSHIGIHYVYIRLQNLFVHISSRVQRWYTFLLAKWFFQYKKRLEVRVFRWFVYHLSTANPSTVQELRPRNPIRQHP